MNGKMAALAVGIFGAVGAGSFLLLRKKAVPVSDKPASSVGNISDGAKLVEVPEINISFMNKVVDSVASVLQPRGIRNNNPGNIKWNSLNNWNGQIGKDSGGFSIFDKPENGIRAAAKILDSYAKRGVVTIESIVKTWAPASDKNNVEAYTRHIEKALGKARGYRVTRADYLPLLKVIIAHENGKQPYTDSQILAGINAA